MDLNKPTTDVTKIDKESKKKELLSHKEMTKEEIKKIRKEKKEAMKRAKKEVFN